MNMNFISKRKWWLLATTLTIVVSFVVYQLIGLNRRLAYETWLSVEMKKIPHLNEPDLKKIAKFDRPDMAAIQNYFMTIDPQLKRVPLEKYKIAMQQAKDFQRQKDGLLQEPIEWNSIPASMGGRTRALMFDPNDASKSKVWAGSVTGGLWYNDNIHDVHSSWNVVDDFWPGLSISCITSDPQNPQVFYAGTGEPFTALVTYRESSGLGMGIMKSEDAGQTWDLMESTTGFQYVTSIKVRIENGVSVIYAGVVSGKYKGQDHLSLPSDGLFRSDDNGVSWQQVLPNIPGEQVPFSPDDIIFGNENRILVGTLPNIDEKGGGYILYSDEGISGSWNVIDDYYQAIVNAPDYNKPGRVMLASCASSPATIYSIVGSGYVEPSNGFNYFYGNYIIKSTDNGETWQSVSVPEPNEWGSWASIAWHAFTISVDPNYANRVYIGGLDVYKTENGGTDWTRVSDWTGMYNPGSSSDYVHADIHQILYAPGCSDTLIIGTDGGVFYTSDAMDSQPYFSEHVENYNTLQFYSCDIHPDSTASFILGGLQDNGSVLFDGNTITKDKMLSGGDGAYCFIDKMDPLAFYTSVYYNRYYAFYENEYLGSINLGQSGTFINPADYNPATKSIYSNAGMFGGDYSDHLAVFSGLPYDATLDFYDLATGTSVPFSFVKIMDTTATNVVLFVGSQSGRLFKVIHAESNPVALEIGSAGFPEANISCVDFKSDTLIVVFSNYGVSSIWLSTDGGANWAERENNLPDMPVRWVLINPLNTDEVLIATETGVWFCNSITSEQTQWVPASIGMGNVRVDMLKLREEDNTVLAATHGRGFYTGKFAGTPDFISNVKTKEPILVWPSLAKDFIHLDCSSLDGNEMNVQIFSGNGSLVYNHVKAKESDVLYIDINNLIPGNYIVTIESRGKRSAGRFVKI